MNRGEPLFVKELGRWEPAKYEFRVEQGEPLGHHSVMLDSGGGRRVVCGCQLSLEPFRCSVCWDGQRMRNSALPHTCSGCGRIYFVKDS